VKEGGLSVPLKLRGSGEGETAARNLEGLSLGNAEKGGDAEKKRPNQEREAAVLMEITPAMARERGDVHVKRHMAS